MGKNGYIVIEVTEKEWEALFELDSIDYNNDHKYVRHTSVISDDEEDELPAEEQEAFISDEIPIPTAIAEKMDKENLFAKLCGDNDLHLLQ